MRLATEGAEIECFVSIEFAKGFERTRRLGVRSIVMKSTSRESLIRMHVQGIGVRV